MGKKTKNKKINKNPIPATTDSARSNNILFEFEAHISKLEGQLREIEARREAEIAAALESGRKEGYIKGCQERLEAVRQAVDVTGADASRQLPAAFPTDSVTGSTTSLPSASASYIPREITVLRSSSRNPWGGLSRRHRRSHPCKPSSHIRHHPVVNTTNNCIHTPVAPPPSFQTFEMVRHPYGIGPVKPVIRTPIANSFVAPPVHHTPLISESISQPLLRTTFFHYILFKFVPGMVSYTHSVFSQFSILFWRRRGRRLVRGGTCARERSLWPLFGLVWPFP